MTSPNNRASLGCGTLILIALIVIIFGNSNRHDSGELKHQLNDLRAEIINLKTEIGNQSATLTQVKQSLDEINLRAAKSRPRVVPAARPQATPELESPKPLPEN